MYAVPLVDQPLVSLMFGSHLSIAGGLTNALIQARELNLDCVQVFTKNQRQWNVKPLTDDERDRWRNELAAMDWTDGQSAARVVSHNSYLVNLASPDESAREKSIELQRKELERCEALDIPLLVAHPGAHLGPARSPKEANDLTGEPSAEERTGLDRIADALNQLHRDLPGYRVMTCLETTVGSGTNLGYAFHHLRYIREHTREPERVGYCFDTCHVTAAGYDMSTDSKAKAVLDEWDDVCGFEGLYCFHLNDSIGEIGSRKDRHAHIAEGTCGVSCFRAIVNHPRFQTVPKILETPKEETPKGEQWDLENIRRLKRLIRSPAGSR